MPGAFAEVTIDSAAPHFLRGTLRAQDGRSGAGGSRSRSPLRDGGCPRTRRPTWPSSGRPHPGSRPLALAAAEAWATSRSCRSTRCRSTGAWTSARPSRPPPSRPPSPHHLIDLADPARSSRWPGSRPRRPRSIAGIESRGAPGPARRRHRALLQAVVDELRPPGRGPGAAGRLEARPRRAEGLRRLLAELPSLDPVAAGRIDPDNARRIVRALEVIHGHRPAVLVVRPRMSGGRGPAAAGRGWSGSGCPGTARRRRIAARIAAMVDAGWSTRSRRLAAAAGRAVRARPGRRSGTRRSWTTSRDPSPRSRQRSPHGRAHPAARPPPAHVVPPRPAHHLDGHAAVIRSQPFPRFWQRGIGMPRWEICDHTQLLEAPRHRQRLPRADRSRGALRARGPQPAGRRRCGPRSATGAGASAPTG